MDAYKIDHFANRYGIEFPRFRSLSESECDQVLSGVASRLGLSNASDALTVVSTLDERQTVVAGESAVHDSFELLRVLPPHGAGSGKLLLNWYRFDAIDEFDADILVTLFSDIWYQSVDDIDVFDATLSWFVSIRHDGVVKRLELAGKLRFTEEPQKQSSMER